MLRNKAPYTAGNGTDVLVPVDFSEKSELAVNVGFELARRLGYGVTLIHATSVVTQEQFLQFPDDLYGLDTNSAEIEEMEVQSAVNKIDAQRMHELEEQVKALQASNKLPDIAYKTVTAAGTPEEVIKDYCSAQKPPVIVMATRGKEKRSEELIGSVTAEVIDQAIAPVMTVPEHYTFCGFKAIVNICAFCYFDEGDTIAIKHLMEMFGHPEVTIHLFPAVSKPKGEAMKEKLQALETSLKKEYPQANFKAADVADIENLRSEVEKYFQAHNIQMILAPNKRRYGLGRIFNPGLAHKVLYEVDFPMFAFPV
ncbi:MAG: universal stress protein [Muribaculaceae bacterium]|nr:universal stress protein [Muribaculaceae bacterium]